MNRGAFISGIAIVLLAAALAGGAPPDAKLWRIGYLDQGSEANNRLYVDGLKHGLGDLGWIEGRTIIIESRFAEGKTDQLPRLAAELVRSKVDVIVTSTTPAALAAKHATTTVPIVIGFVADPVGSGIVASLARPGGNITGWTHSGRELRAKYLGLLKDAVPSATRFGVLWNPANQVHQPSMQNIEDAARQVKVELHLAGAREPKELERAVSGLMEKRIQALVVFPDGMFQSQTSQIVALAARYRLPAVYGLREFAEAGGLIAYGANLATMHRELSASLVDKILKGARPATLPVAQPTKFDLLINLKTAKALGLTIPPSLLARADQVIE
jgi:putative ABC transport system substrate-binding protein